MTFRSAKLVAGRRPETSIKVRFATLLCALALAALDGTIVATALPVIASDLGGLNHLAWVVTSFTLAQSATLLLYGKLSDMYGRRPVFLFAVVTFIVGSAGCGFARTMPHLILMRAVQGVGAGGLITLAQIVLADTFSPRERGRYQGLFTVTFTACNVAGPLLGGLITSVVGWRWIFLMNLPLGLAVLALLARNLPRSAPAGRRRIDVLGAGLIIATTISGLLVVSWGGGVMPWTAPLMLGLIAVCAVGLVATVAQEARAKEPILDLSLFRDRVFTGCALTAALIGFPFLGALVFLPLYFQLCRGFSPAGAGMVILPQIFGLLCASVGGGFLVSHFGRYKPFLVAGTALLGGGMWLTGFLMRTQAPVVLIMGALFVLGLGVGCCMPNLTLAVQNALGRTRTGAGTAFINFANSVSAAAGVATSGSLLVQRLHNDLARVASPADVSRMTHYGLREIAALAEPARDLMTGAYARAIAQSFTIGGLTVMAAVIAALLAPSRELRRDRGQVVEAVA
jgi:EmrB/QacA subfamily drug resistance transporter